MKSRVDAYLSKAKNWREEMTQLRTIALACGLTEELKWGKPCYTFQDSNVVLIIPFKNSCAFLFGKGALLKDPKGILIQPTENTQAARQIRFTSVREIAKQASTLKAYLREAIALEKAGRDVEYKATSEFPMPEELRRKFGRDPAFKKAFHALTPGRQRGYLLHFAAAKQSQTREARIEKCLPRIFEGKGWNEFDRTAKPKTPKSKTKDGVVLLSGGNPQIAKADGNAPVQAYIAAMPGWKSKLGQRLDTLITRAVPKVQKAVKWNSPFYGIDSWFLTFHVLTRCVKVTFFNGQSLKPMPDGHTDRSGKARWLDIYEDDQFDEKQFTKWVKQSAALPGWVP